MKMAAPAIILAALSAGAPSAQADTCDSTFAPSKTNFGTVPDRIPRQGPGSAMTDGETSTRGAVSATDSPTAARGSSDASASQNGSAQ